MELQVMNTLIIYASVDEMWIPIDGVPASAVKPVG